MLLDNDAYVYDAYICDIQSLTMLHVCMMQLKFCDHSTNQPTNEQGDSRSRMQYADTYEVCIYDACMCDACQKWGWTNQPTNKAILGVG